VHRLVGPRLANGSWQSAGGVALDDATALCALIPHLVQHDMFISGPAAWTAAVRRVTRRDGGPVNRSTRRPSSGGAAESSSPSTPFICVGRGRRSQHAELVALRVGHHHVGRPAAGSLDIVHNCRARRAGCGQSVDDVCHPRRPQVPGNVAAAARLDGRDGCDSSPSFLRGPCGTRCAAGRRRDPGSRYRRPTRTREPRSGVASPPRLQILSVVRRRHTRARASKTQPEIPGSHNRMSVSIRWTELLPRWTGASPRPVR